MRTPRLTYGSVTATIALFVALGGSSYAALKITGSDIRNGTVTGADLKDGSVKGRDVANGTIRGSDLKNGSVTGSDVADGSLLAADFVPGQLPAGAAGPAGPAGPQGPGGLTDVVSRRVDLLVAEGSTETGTASCLQGEIASGGGAGYSGPPDTKVAIVFDEPLDADGSPPDVGERATQWRAFINNATPAPAVPSW